MWLDELFFWAVIAIILGFAMLVGVGIVGCIHRGHLMDEKDRRKK
jgi:hypothetical protein